MRCLRDEALYENTKGEAHLDDEPDASADEWHAELLTWAIEACLEVLPDDALEELLARFQEPELFWSSALHGLA